MPHRHEQLLRVLMVATRDSPTFGRDRGKGVGGMGEVCSSFEHPTGSDKKWDKKVLHPQKVPTIVHQFHKNSQHFRRTGFDRRGRRPIR
jgi:hypothetical protein